MIPNVTIISGATCSGKTEIALKLALENDAEIISCDSVQVYRGMDIGSAKISRQERKNIKHYLIDVADCSEHFDISRYVELAKIALGEILKRGKNIIVVGGSGFYLKSWFHPVTDNLPIPKIIAEKVDEIDKEGGLESLANALKEVDCDCEKFIDMRNPRRVKNALKRCMASGKRIAVLLDEFSKLPCPFGEMQRKFILLERSDIDIRIDKRTEEMFENDALVRECEMLLSLGIDKNPSARNAIGYRETLDWICSGKKGSVDNLVRMIAENTKFLVKKQRKFFKNTLNATPEIYTL